MKKIFACDQFTSDENNEYSLSGVTPEEYLANEKHLRIRQPRFFPRRCFR